MNWKCFFGHNFLESGRKLVGTENWYKVYHESNVKVPGSDFTKKFYVTVETCSKCGAKIGARLRDNGWGYQEIDAKYAQDIIDGKVQEQE